MIWGGMDGFRKKAVGVFATLAFALLVGAKLVLDLISISLVGDDVATLREQMPAWAVFLTDLPSWIFVLPMLIIIFFAIWAFWPERKAAAERSAREEKARQSLETAWELRHLIETQKDEIDAFNKELSSDLVSSIEGLTAVVQQHTADTNEKLRELSGKMVFSDNYAEDRVVEKQLITSLIGGAEKRLIGETKNMRTELHNFLISEVESVIRQQMDIMVQRIEQARGDDKKE